MKIIEKEDINSLRIVDLKCGELFKYNGTFYMKMFQPVNNPFNCIDLLGGMPHKVNDYQYVVRFDAKLVEE